MFRPSSLFLVCCSLLLIAQTGCKLSHSPCDSARGPLMFGSPCGDCSGCGELYIDPWINHPPKKMSSCSDCDGSPKINCQSCRPISSGLKSVLGHSNLGNCDGLGPGGEVTCGIDHKVSCDGCDHCAGQDPIHRIEEVTTGIPVTSAGKSIQIRSKNPKTVRSVNQVRYPIAQGTAGLQNPSSRSKYPMDTPRIYRNRSIER